jgi:hypothetical protein
MEILPTILTQPNVDLVHEGASNSLMAAAAKGKRSFGKD